jgi:hypothetical protein
MAAKTRLFEAEVYRTPSYVKAELDDRADWVHTLAQLTITNPA